MTAVEVQVAAMALIQRTTASRGLSRTVEDPGALARLASALLTRMDTPATGTPGPAREHAPKEAA